MWGTNTVTTTGDRIEIYLSHQDNVGNSVANLTGPTEYAIGFTFRFLTNGNGEFILSTSVAAGGPFTGFTVIAPAVSANETDYSLRFRYENNKFSMYLINQSDESVFTICEPTTYQNTSPLYLALTQRLPANSGPTIYNTFAPIKFTLTSKLPPRKQIISPYVTRYSKFLKGLSPTAGIYLVDLLATVSPTVTYIAQFYYLTPYQYRHQIFYLYMQPNSSISLLLSKDAIPRYYASTESPLGSVTGSAWVLMGQPLTYNGIPAINGSAFLVGGSFPAFEQTYSNGAAYITTGKYVVTIELFIIPKVIKNLIKG